MSLPVAAVESLDAELTALSRRSYHGHARLVERLAVSFRPCDRATDALPEERVHFDSFRMLSLSHRWVERGGVLARVIVLAAHKPTIDLPGSGRIRFACEAAFTVGRLGGGRLVPDPRQNPSACRAAVLMAREVEDADQAALAEGLVLPAFYFAYPFDRPPVFEAAVPPADWQAAEVRIGDLRAWPAPFFARSAEDRWAVHPVDGSSDPFADESGPIADGTLRGSWIFRDGVATPRAQRPVAVYADLGPLACGRSIRNPAWNLLREHDIIPSWMTYRQWLEQLSPHAGPGRPVPDPGEPTTAAGRFRAALAAHVDAGAGRAEALIAGVRDACIAAGVPIPLDEEKSHDYLCGLLENPWIRAEVPAVAAIQGIRLAGMPDAGSMTFSTGTVEANLYVLGEHAARFEQVPARRVREVFRQKFGRRATRSTTNPLP